jgi:glutamate-ammonia-ligase adenylyltransferase
MTDYSALDWLRTLPRAADPERAAHGRAAWLDAAEATAPARAAIADPGFRALADAAFGNSPFLARCLIAEPDLLPRFLDDGPAALVDQAIAALADSDRADRPALMRRLRIARARVAATVALADIAGIWSLHRVTGALSRLADAAVGAALRHLLRALAAERVVELADADAPERASGAIVLALGKLGAHELNYSSDIDIMVLFDPEVVRWVGAGHPQAAFVRLTRELVRILQERTADGFVVRTDLRLRPDPAATPLALSTEAAELYYESLGQNWERAAMIKARAMAGDAEAGDAFLRRLTPFVWRKHLDFAAIQDIHSIKRQINAHHGGARIAVAGHNIKVGRGGIREIEFYAQTQQLIWGGRNPALRSGATCDALRALTVAGHMTEDACAELVEAYRFLRNVEHRLQMIDDQQTQTLPAAEAKLAQLATFLGHPSSAAFADALRARLETVERRYAALFEEAPELAPQAGNLVFTGTEDDPGTLTTLSALGFGNASIVAAAIRGWHHGRYRAMRSTRARELLTEITPTLLAALARTADPDSALARFDEFLRNLPAGVQLFSLFYSRPHLLDLVATIMGTAPRLAEVLSHNVALLDSVLGAEFDEALPPADALTASLGAALDQARDEEDELDIARRWTHDRQFQVGVQMLRRAVPPERAHAMLSDLAEAVVRAMLPRVEASFAAAHGRVPGAEFAVLGLGKLGGREMTATSDLDLVFVYRVPDGIEASDGAKPLPPSTYFARLSQRLLNALSALTAEGRLYEIDMRLRPSGAKGPVASDIEGFLAYQRDAAWTWEHMALTRARVLCGAADFRARIEAGIRAVLAAGRPAAKLAADIAAMRVRIAAEHGSDDPWHVKHVRGGLVDIEFIAQYVQLREAARHPEILATGTVAALERAARAGCLDGADARALIDAAVLLGRVQGLLRLTLADQRIGDEAPRALGDLIASTAGVPDLATLRQTLVTVETDVKSRFDRIVEAAASGS